MPCTPPEHHKIIKTHRIFIIFLYFIGNYVACKNYTHTQKNLFIHLTRSHFSLIAKSCVALGTPSLSSLTRLKFPRLRSATCLSSHRVSVYRVREGRNGQTPPDRRDLYSVHFLFMHEEISPSYWNPQETDVGPPTQNCRKFQGLQEQVSITLAWITIGSDLRKYFWAIIKEVI